MQTRHRSRQTAADSLSLPDLGDDLLGLILAATGATLPQTLRPISWWLEDDDPQPFPRSCKWRSDRHAIRLSCKRLKAAFDACNPVFSVGWRPAGVTPATSSPTALVHGVPSISTLTFNYNSPPSHAVATVEDINAPKVPEVIHAMRDPSTLRELHIQGHGSIDPPASFPSISAFSGLVALTITGGGPPRGGVMGPDLSPLAACRSLRRLHIINVDYLQVSSLGSLGKEALGLLEELNLGGCFCLGWDAGLLLPCIAQATRLKRLGLQGIWIADLSPFSSLSSLTALEYLDLRNNVFFSLSPLSACTSLKTLNLDNTGASDLSPLSHLVNLERLSWKGADVSELRPLSGLPRLQHLDCSNTSFFDLGPLSGLASLQHLVCRQCTRVQDLSPLAGLLNLTRLDLGGTGVTTVRSLAACTNLRRLDLTGTKVKSLPACLRAGLLLLVQARPQLWEREGEDTSRP